MGGKSQNDENLSQNSFSSKVGKRSSFPRMRESMFSKAQMDPAFAGVTDSTRNYYFEIGSGC
jgi:hypothetical protein